MRIDILTIFPEIFGPVLNSSILKIAQKKKKVSFRVLDLRRYTRDRHRKVDDKPFGGGPGMVMQAEPIYRAVEALRPKTTDCRPKTKTRVILLTPQGKTLTQTVAKKLSKAKHLILICGHYEGVDERVRRIVTDEISIGDYVLTGGEIPAMVLIDTVVRLLPGVVGDEGSLEEESFSGGLIEYPHYTRPAVFRGMKVPEVLLQGDHKKIAEWRKAKALERTKQRRPDLLRKRGLYE